jgi:hypothetical protein
VEAITVKEFFTRKLQSYDMVLAWIPKYAQQHGIAELGKIYRTKFLFRSQYFALDHKQLDFVGGGGTFGDAGNYEGEVGFLFLANRDGKAYQCHYQGHLPIERHEDGLWCMVYGAKLWEFREVPDIIRDNSKPNTRRLNSNGEPFDTWVRFEVLESYLKDLIGELDQKPCEPFDMADVQPWLESPKPAM